MLFGKMYFCGFDQLYGFEECFMIDIYLVDFGWVFDWDSLIEWLSWYYNMSLVFDVGLCVCMNQFDFDDEVMFVVKQKLYDVVCECVVGYDVWLFCMVVLLIYLYDLYVIMCEYWDCYDDDEIDMLVVWFDVVDSDLYLQWLCFVCENDCMLLIDVQICVVCCVYYGVMFYVDMQFGSVLVVFE